MKKKEKKKDFEILGAPEKSLKNKVSNKGVFISVVILMIILIIVLIILIIKNPFKKDQNSINSGTQATEAGDSKLGYEGLKKIYEEAGLELSTEESSEENTEDNSNDSNNSNDAQSPLEEHNDEEIEKAKEDDALLNPDFDPQLIANDIIDQTTRYNKYIDAHGGLYDELGFDNPDYDDAKKYNDQIVGFLVNGKEFDTLFASCTDYGNTYIYAMVNDLSFSYVDLCGLYYEDICKNYFKIGHPIISNVSNLSLNYVFNEDKEFDSCRPTFTLTFSSNGNVYKAWIMEEGGDNGYNYTMLDLELK